jgi:drug/metabolite transporter (DMT)-like permease
MTAQRSQATIGLTLAIFGALLLTPDTLFMRLSQLDGLNMLLWRGGLSGLAYFMIWFWMRGPRDLSNIWTRNFAIIVACQTGNAALFSLAIAIAPVTVVLIGVATVPIFAAILSRFMLGEALSMRTLVTATSSFWAYLSVCWAVRTGKLSSTSSRSSVQAWGWASPSAWR